MLSAALELSPVTRQVDHVAQWTIVPLLGPHTDVHPGRVQGIDISRTRRETKGMDRIKGMAKTKKGRAG